MKMIILSLLLLNITAYAHGISEADMQAMIEGGNLHYIWLGATHMLTGYDHLLFLFGVVFFQLIHKLWKLKPNNLTYFITFIAIATFVDHKYVPFYR